MSLSRHGYAANQFLIIFPDVLIDGAHEPTTVHLNSFGRDSKVIVMAHTAPTPMSNIARNVFSLKGVSIFGPAVIEQPRIWDKDPSGMLSISEGRTTVFEVIVPKEKSDKRIHRSIQTEIDWDDLTNPIVRASRGINLYLTALRIIFETQFSMISQGNLQGPIFHRMCRIKESIESDIPSISVRALEDFYICVNGTRAPELDLHVDFDEEKVVELEVVLDDVKTGNRILASKERLVAARTALYVQGDLGAAVLESATASEMFLDTVLTMLFWEKSVKESGSNFTGHVAPNEAVVQIFNLRDSITKRIKNSYHPILGGEPWSLDSGELRTWHTNCFLLRHRVIHGGYLPSFSESRDSIEAAHELVNFVLNKLCVKKNEYPRTTWMLLGEKGLRKRSSFSHKYKAIFNGIADAEPHWRRSYAEYRELVSNAMLKSM